MTIHFQNGKSLYSFKLEYKKGGKNPDKHQKIIFKVTDDIQECLKWIAQTYPKWNILYHEKIETKDGVELIDYAYGKEEKNG